MGPEDDPMLDDPHAECAAEIELLNGRLDKANSLLRDLGPEINVVKLATAENTALRTQLTEARAALEQRDSLLVDIEGNCGNCKELIRAAALADGGK